MDTSGLVLLVVSAAVSFGLGRVVVHFRNKRKKASQNLADMKAAQALRDAPVGPEPKNKSKRKRQAQLSAKLERDRSQR